MYPPLYLKLQKYLPSIYHVLRPAQCYKLHVNITDNSSLPLCSSFLSLQGLLLILSLLQILPVLQGPY